MLYVCIHIPLTMIVYIILYTLYTLIVCTSVTFMHMQVNCIVGCGSALLRNELLQRYIKDEFTLPLQLRSVSAAFGAALSTKYQTTL